MSIYRGRSCRDVYLASLLYDAIDDNNIKAMNLLLEKGADPNLILPRKGISSFHRIIGCDSLNFTIKATCLALQFGGNPNIKSDDGLTPLHIAAAWGRIDILQILLSCGGDPEATDANYQTPIYYANKGEFPECSYLLKSYLPIVSLLEKEPDNCCDIKLEKILVNNGFAVGEYHFLPEQFTEFNIKDKCAKNDNISEYVMSWFKKCESNVEHQTSIISTDNEIYNNNISLRKPQRRIRQGSISIINSDNLPKIDDKQPQQQFSKESGIVVSSNEYQFWDSTSETNCLNENINPSNISKYLENTSSNCNKSNSSEYMTCLNSILERNIFEFSENKSLKENPELTPTSVMNESSIIAVSEIYKYEDKDEGIVLFEKRLIRTPSECADSIKSGSISSKMSSLPDNFDYDTDTLRIELTSLGFIPGPITKTTKRLYLKKLYRLKKYSILNTTEANKIVSQKCFSVELEKTRKNYECFNDLSCYKSLEEIIIKEFSVLDPTRKWREGFSKSSFTYLLLDPRVTNKLPYRFDNLEQKDVWDTFLSAIFYIGKGKKSRPYSHLYDAVSLWKADNFKSENKKLKRILDIWKNDSGVVCLHVFHNVIPVEAYTREAAMIAAIKLENLTNVKSGEFYGVAAAWPQRNKKSLGVYLLYKAMKIFIQDGERQIYPRDIE